MASTSAILTDDPPTTSLEPISVPTPDPTPHLADDSLIKTYGSPVGKIIGEGTYGKVYLTDKNYAVKIMARFNRGSKLPDVNFQRTLLSGITFPVCLHHPNIIKIHNVYIGTHDITVVMPAYQGDLVHMVGRYPGILRRPEIFKSLAAQMVSALAYLTSRGIIHLDIKPQNILYQHVRGSLYHFALADFDLAQDRRCEAGNVQKFEEYYTEPFRPPELFFFEEGVLYNESADVWAMGVTLASVYMGKHIFWNGNRPQDTMKNILQLVPRGDTRGSTVSPLWNEVDGRYTGGMITNGPEVEVFIRKMIQFEPRARTSIFDLQYDDFIKGFITDLIEPNTCVQRILYFDRRVDFRPMRNPRMDGFWSKVVGWMLEGSKEFRFKTRSTLTMIELFGRYILLQGDGAQLSAREIQLIGSAAIYTACKYTGTSISLEKVKNLSNDIYTHEQIIRRSEDLLIQLNFDLCAKTPYDDIFRFRSLYPREILVDAINFVSCSAIYPDLYFEPENTQIALSIALENAGIPTIAGITQDQILGWKAKLKNHYEVYVGNLEDFFERVIQKL